MKHFSKFLFRIALSLLFICISHTSSIAESRTLREKMETFEDRLSDIAERYIGMPYKFGADPEQNRAADNSHLLCKIYDEAAKKAGLKFAGYMPMNDILQNTIQIQRHELRNGDLMVLDDGHAGMIYRFKSQYDFKIIYASYLKQQIISFSCQNVVFEAYWMENLKGFFRLNQGLLMDG